MTATICFENCGYMQLYKALEGQPYWLQILDWVEKVEKQQGNLSRHPDFEWVDTQIHELLSGSRSSQSQASPCTSTYFSYRQNSFMEGSVVLT